MLFRSERQKVLKCSADAYFGVCLYILTNSFDPSETKKFVSGLMCALFPKSCSVHVSRLLDIVMSAFQTTKVCRVRFLDYKSFVVCAFLLQKFCSVRFFTSKVCSLRFFRLQKFVEFDVSEQLTLAKQVIIIQSLCPPDIYITLTNEKSAYGLGREHLDV